MHMCFFAAVNERSRILPGGGRTFRVAILDERLPMHTGGMTLKCLA